MKISVFDLDRTLFSKNSSFEFCKYLYKKRVFSSFFLTQSCLYYFQHKYLGLPLEQLHHRVFDKLLQGLPFSLLADHVQTFLEEKIEKLLYRPSLERLRRAQHEGEYTMILSNSPSFLVEKIAERLGVDAWKSSEYQVDKDQKLCQISQILQGKDKAFWVGKFCADFGVQKEEITAYSDSYLDIPFLQSAGIAVVVNPDKRLKKLSQEKGWEEI